MDMSFKELYEKVQQGIATEEETKLVEEELEKFEILTERYLENDLFSENPEAKSEDENRQEFSAVKKAVRKRTFIIIASAVFVVALLFFLGMQLFNNVIKPYLNEQVYYDPGSYSYSDTYSYSQNTNDLSIELATLTELHFPGTLTNYATTENTGIGKYDLTINWTDMMKPYDVKYQYGRVDSGKIRINQEFFRFVPMNQFAYGTYPFDDLSVWPDTAAMKKKIAELPNYTSLEVSLSFERDLSMKEIAVLLDKYPELYFSWIGVRNAPRTEQNLPLIGFDPTGTGYIYEGINEAYPYYELADDAYPERTEEVLEGHFKSLLQFQIDNKKLLESIEGSNVSGEYYQGILDYINENEAASYGIVVQGHPAEILKICAEEPVCKISVDDIILQMD